jgi:hypothetical protein
VARVVLAALTIAVLVTAGAAGGGTDGARVLTTRGRVVDLAADGPRVAIGIEATSRSCDRLVVWNPSARRTAAWNARTSCRPGSQASAGEFLVEVALAGVRAAWVEAYQGNLQDLVLTTKTPGGRPIQVAFAENHGGAEGSPEGDFVGHLHGDGGLLAYNIWSVCIAYPAGSVVEPPPRPPCDAPLPGSEPEEVVFGQQLFRVGSVDSLASGTAAYAIQAVDARRIATLQDDGVTLLDATGATLLTVPFSPGAVRGVALSGAQLALLRDDGRLDVYDTGTGAKVQTTSVALPATARLTDMKNGVALAVAGRSLWLVRLAADEAEVIMAPRAIVDAELEASGLFYAWNLTGGARRGRVAFVPWAKLEGLHR